jgi:leucyl/phenylalanyl-tRNA--protein transferase
MIPAQTLIAAYASGYFPMGMDDGEIGWFSPDPRGILPLEGFHVSRRLARVVRQGRFSIEIDRGFRQVIEACASVRGGEDEGTWITDEIVESYCELHRLGWAHSVEAWRDGRLAGGLYGVSLRGAFFGESMFHRETDASKAALCALVDRLRAREYRLLDIQWVTPHLAGFGAIEIPRRRYLALLESSLHADCRFVP